MSLIKTPSQIDAMRHGGRILAQVLELLVKKTAVGLSPKDMAQLASNELKRLGGEPAFLGYQGYPEIICISVNNQVQHSIPTSRQFKEGDIINYDFGVRYRGMITDAGVSCAVGKPTVDTNRLLTGTEQALKDGLKAIKAGAKVGDISAAVETTLKKHRLGIVRELVGHGVGMALHEEPEIPNYGSAGTGPTLQAGMTIAIEPIANLGGDAIMADPDGWTLWTADGSWSAQFEHTVLVTQTGYEILTI